MIERTMVDMTGSPATGDRHRVLAVRPYASEVCSTIFALLERLGWPVDPDIVPMGTSDDDAIRAALPTKHGALLVPYHGHLTAAGRPIDGVHFLYKLAQKSGVRTDVALPWRVIMPVTNLSRATLALAALPDDALTRRVREAIAFVDVNRLDDRAVEDRLRSHLSALQEPTKA